MGKAARRKTPAPKSTPRARLRLDTILLGILALALFVRLWGVTDRLPDPTLGINPIVQNTVVDEGDRRAMDFAWRMWRGGAKPLDLNPKTGDWPGLPFYLTLACQGIYRGYDAIVHGTSSATEFAERMEHDPRGMFLLARVVGVLVGTITVFLTYLVGARLGGRWVGLTAALILALNPFHILSSQRVADPNLLALLFVLLATVQLVGNPSEDRVRRGAIAGAMIGLAAACKYVPIVLLPIVVIANIERRRIHAKAIGAAVLASALAFFIASPFTLLDLANKSHDFAMQRGRLLSEWVGLSEAPISLPTYFTRTFPQMLGWPGYLLAIVGTAVLFAHRPRGWAAAAVPIALLLPTGTMALAQERFMVPAIGSLVVAAAFAVWYAARKFTTAPALAILALAVAWPLPGYLHTRQALHLPDTRTLAHRWIQASIPGTEPMAVDVYGPEFPPRFDERLAFPWPFLVTQAPMVRVAYRPEYLDGLRYYVSSSEVSRRFEAAASRYPLEAAFHRWIQDHGRVVWSSDSLHASGPRIEVRALPEGISTREERDRAWAEGSRGPMYTPRIARWCSEMASIFLRRDEYDRAAEWGARGLAIQDTISRKSLFETLALAEVRLDRAAAGEATAREGLAFYPESPLLHVDRAMALETLGRTGEAVAEYQRALNLGASEASAEVIRAQIARLEHGSR